jgi:hypothetical protein
MEKLPECCYAYNPGSGETVFLKKGVVGYYAVTFEDDKFMDAEEANKRLGVTKFQAHVMMLASMAGWHVPGADVDHYTQEEKFQIELHPMLGFDLHTQRIAAKS